MQLGWTVADPAMLNANTTERYQSTYGPTYANPLSIMSARFFKISAQFDF